MTTVTEVLNESFGLVLHAQDILQILLMFSHAPPLVSFITTRYYVATIIFQRRVWYRALSLLSLIHI